MGRRETVLATPAAAGSTPSPGAPGTARLAERFRRVRAETVALTAPLAIEDQVVQTMPDVSPTKWHLAHTSWFFETFVLQQHLPGYARFDERFSVLFNSYYETVGEQHPRPERGLLSRPTVSEVHAYRAHVDRAVERLLELEGTASAPSARLATLIELGLNHEQQHQELLLADAKHVLSHSPLDVVYAPREPDGGTAPEPAGWRAFPEQVAWIGHEGRGFAFDNEQPRHRVLVQAFELARRPVSQGEFLAFVEDGGYRRPELWLADGFERARREGWTAPLYWRRVAGGWRRFSLAGERALEPGLAVSHVSFFEADAYARWAGARLPSEAEWELAAQRAAAEGSPSEGALLDGSLLAGGRLDPAPLAPRAARGEALERLFGDVWEWTSSPYGPYPGFRPLDGSLGEYNGKFMCSQLVCRGGSWATQRGHVRPSYRNFFYPAQRWQLTGLRLARDPVT